MISTIAPSGNPGIDSRIMFERYTEKARRVVFFALYEASQYGSPVIASEHILLGLLREDRTIMRRFAGVIQVGPEIRAEIERLIKRGEPFATSVEVPLSGESKRILNFAGEEADRLNHRHIGTEHILLGILRLQDSLAASLLMARGAKADAIREQIARDSASATKDPPSAIGSTDPPKGALTTLDDFLGLLRAGPSKQAAAFFHDKGQFVDSSGKRWLGPEIEQAAEILFAPFAKRNANFFLKSTTKGPSETFLASLLWELAAASSDRSKSLLRMSIVLASTGEEWTILLMQVTPLTLS
jgi:Clp amino terminal domain, pathogenicity island component